jgi:HD superfamily phosphodiesterase
VNYRRAQVVKLLIAHFGEDDRRIDHAMKVLVQAEQIRDGREDVDLDILIAVALLHDVGIKPSEEELGYNNGKTQERYGPPLAEEMLQSIEFPPEKIEIVSRIIGNHHSPSHCDYPELSVLKEADRIVNREEAGN